MEVQESKTTEELNILIKRVNEGDVDAYWPLRITGNKFVDIFLWMATITGVGIVATEI